MKLPLGDALDPLEVCHATEVFDLERICRRAVFNARVGKNVHGGGRILREEPAAIALHPRPVMAYRTYCEQSPRRRIALDGTWRQHGGLKALRENARCP